MPTFDLLLPPQSYGARRPARPLDPLAAAGRMILIWRARSRQRDALARLDNAMLRDIGITRAEAMRECEKPFWR